MMPISKLVRTITGGENVPSLSVSTEAVFEALSNRRRQMVLQQVIENGSMEIAQLAERIAAEENGVEVRKLTSQQRKRVYVSLYQSHLGKMDEKGLIEYDDGRDITPGENAEAAMWLLGKAKMLQ